jgi:hypothetical protein
VSYSNAGSWIERQQVLVDFERMQLPGLSQLPVVQRGIHYGIEEDYGPGMGVRDLEATSSLLCLSKQSCGINNRPVEEIEIPCEMM